MQKLNELFSGGGDGEGANDSFLEDGSEGLCSLSTTQRMYGFAASLAAGLLLIVRLEEGTVRSLIEEKGVVKGVTYKNSSGEETTSSAPLTVVCDGCHSNLRHSLNDNNAEVTAYEIGYISRNCRLEQPDKLHLIMAKPSFAMMYQISSTDVRCNFELLSKNLPSVSNGEMASFVKNSIAPQVPLKLRKTFLKGLDEGSHIKITQAKRMPATLSRKKGVIVLGDAFNMRHPVIASGMMVLLSDILILSRLLKPLGNLGDENEVSEVMKSFYVLRKEEVLSYFVGYVTKNTRLEDPHSMHLIFSKPLPCVVYQITSNEVRCAAEVPADSIPSIANGEMVNFLKKTVAPQVRMMVALSDVLILRNLLRPVPSFSNTKKVLELVKSIYIIRKPMSATVNTLAHVFSEVLVATTDEAREGMRESCFNYLSSGGFRTSGMMAILGGMNPRPLSLVFHLVCITLTAMGHLLSPFPSPRRFWHSLRVFALALKMLGAHLGDEGLKEMLIPTNAASYRKSYMATASDWSPQLIIFFALSRLFNPISNQGTEPGSVPGMGLCILSSVISPV
ncbi:hypothetical protein F2Q68_00036806 [Brassica cretica]|uniref:Squalene monooxygenase n=1 Tax=Brassica cretica TaxID=69181 RepID=A0A8S9HDM2_BRACR|nr:hypothetical protein F2Q68_00036806 [Brassica cretica]